MNKKPWLFNGVQFHHFENIQITGNRQQILTTVNIRQQILTMVPFLTSPRKWRTWRSWAEKSLSGRTHAGFPYAGVSYLFFFLHCLFCFLNWRIIASQYFLVVCYTSTSISLRYTHVPSLANLPTISSPPHPSRLSQSPRWSSLSHIANSHCKRSS